MCSPVRSEHAGHVIQEAPGCGSGWARHVRWKGRGSRQRLSGRRGDRPCSGAGTRAVRRRRRNRRRPWYRPWSGASRHVRRRGGHVFPPGSSYRVWALIVPQTQPRRHWLDAFVTVASPSWCHGQSEVWRAVGLPDSRVHPTVRPTTATHSRREEAGHTSRSQTRRGPGQAGHLVPRLARRPGPHPRHLRPNRHRRMARRTQPPRWQHHPELPAVVFGQQAHPALPAASDADQPGGTMPQAERLELIGRLLTDPSLPSAGPGCWEHRPALRPTAQPRRPPHSGRHHPHRPADPPPAWRAAVPRSRTARGTPVPLDRQPGQHEHRD